MKLLDSRRLTGPNLQTDRPCALLEIEFEEGEDPEAAIAAWRAELRQLIDEPVTAVRRYHGGAALCVEVPLDELLATTDINEWALERATAIAAGRAPDPVEPRRTELEALRTAGRNPRMVALAVEARGRDVPFLWDDTEVSVGAGARGRTWPIEELPAVGAVPWDEIGDIPIALITGTNGKTTSARLCAHMVRCAGLVAGTASTIGVSVGERQVATGDWTGPAAARRVLREPGVEVAILETARGGILRRGLAVDACDAALITNVSADHLGSYGIDDIDTMVRVKAVVARAVRRRATRADLPGGGVVVLCADDPALVALAERLSTRVIFFSREPRNPVVAAHRARGGEVWFVDEKGGAIQWARRFAERTVIAIDEVPITFGGLAAYNVSNALGAAALAGALGISHEAIAAGLRSFGTAAGDNPGRGDLLDAGGVRVMLDYGHNPEGLRAVMALASRLRGDGRLLVIFGQPGDRGDQAMREAAAAVAAAGPAAVFVHDLPAHLRGRQPGEVPALLRGHFVTCGMRPDDVRMAADARHALEAALDEARPGDLVILLPHTDDAAVNELMARRAPVAPLH